MPVEIHAEVPITEDRRNLSRAIESVLGHHPGRWFVSIFEPQLSPEWRVRVEGPGVHWSHVFLGPNEQDPTYIAEQIRLSISGHTLAIREFTINGFGPFEGTTLYLDNLTILVGANGTGKTSLFEFSRAIRHFVRTEVPPEIMPGWETREVYHRPGPDRLGWAITSHSPEGKFYFGANIIGPIGNPVVAEESVVVLATDHEERARLERRGELGWIRDGIAEREIRNPRPNQLAFKNYVNPSDRILHRLKEQIDSWRFFSGIHLDDQQLRQPALIEEAPTIRDDGSNLASVLNWLQSTHNETFRDIEGQIRDVIPAFRGLAIKPTGAGRVTLTWNEEGLVNPLTAADLSDGSLRLLLWVTLALVPNPPALVCIDEPEVGMHPRTLPKIAALLTKLATRTQVLVATHSSYLLAQFDVRSIGILRKRNGSIEFTKAGSSAALVENLREFGAEELELMHRSDELEALT